MQRGLRRIHLASRPLRLLHRRYTKDLLERRNHSDLATRFQVQVAGISRPFGLTMEKTRLRFRFAPFPSRPPGLRLDGVPVLFFAYPRSPISHGPHLQAILVVQHCGPSTSSNLLGANAPGESYAPRLHCVQSRPLAVCIVESRGCPAT